MEPAPPAVPHTPVGIELHHGGPPIAQRGLQWHRLLLQRRQGGPSTQQAAGRKHHSAQRDSTACQRAVAAAAAAGGVGGSGCGGCCAGGCGRAGGGRRLFLLSAHAQRAARERRRKPARASASIHHMSAIRGMSCEQMARWHGRAGGWGGMQCWQPCVCGWCCPTHLPCRWGGVRGAQPGLPHLQSVHNLLSGLQAIGGACTVRAQ